MTNTFQRLEAIYVQEQETPPNPQLGVISSLSWHYLYISSFILSFVYTPISRQRDFTLQMKTKVITIFKLIDGIANLHMKTCKKLDNLSFKNNQCDNTYI